MFTECTHTRVRFTQVAASCATCAEYAPPGAAYACSCGQYVCAICLISWSIADSLFLLGAPHAGTGTGPRPSLRDTGQVTGQRVLTADLVIDTD